MTIIYREPHRRNPIPINSIRSNELECGAAVDGHVIPAPLIFPIDRIFILLWRVLFNPTEKSIDWRLCGELIIRRLSLKQLEGKYEISIISRRHLIPLSVGNAGLEYL